MRSRATAGFHTIGLSGIVLLAFACHDFDQSRAVPARGTVGEEVFAILCDRVGAQALREDMTGGSFRDMCHKPKGGVYRDTVDESRLPKLDPRAKDEKGRTVALEKQEADRARAKGRVEAMARRRQDLIDAIDAVIPATKVGVKNLKAGGAKSCDGLGEDTLPNQVAAMLGRFIDLYNDGTIPQSTQSLARIVKAFQGSEEAQKAWARFDSRQGYRPYSTALGAVRPIIAYPRLRDLSNATLRVMSADSNPYELTPKYDGSGQRIPVKGIAYDAFAKLLEVGNLELKDVKADPVPGLLTITTDPTTGRTVLSRPRDNLEVMQTALFTQDPLFGGGKERYIVKRDARGYALLSGPVGAPFVDANKDGLPDVDDLGRFVTTNGQLAAAPFDYYGGAAATRDQFNRAVQGSGASATLVYDYLDTSHTFAAQVINDLRPLVNPNVDQKHETLMDSLAGAYVLFGPRDGSNATQRAYKTGSVDYNQFKGDQSPLLDLVYAVLQLLGDRNADDVLAMTKVLMTDKHADTARLVGEMLRAKDISNKAEYAQVKLPAKATFWDENLDALAKVAKEPGLLEDLLRAMGDPRSAELGQVYSRYAKFNDLISYDPKNLNGPALNLTTGKAEWMKTPVDRSKPATGNNRSALQRFLSLIVDTIGVTTCNKDGAVAHAIGPGGIKVEVPLLGGTFSECEVFKIDNMAAFYLDAMVNDPKGQLWIRSSFMRNGVGGLGEATVSVMEESSGIKGFWTSGGSTSLQPKPEWLNRLVFFDVTGDPKLPLNLQNPLTQRFLADLNGAYIGTSVCPERTIPDPCVNNDRSCGPADKVKIAPDGRVHGLRNCREGDWLHQRSKNTIFTWEQFGFFEAMTPMLRAFTNRNREDLFLELAAATSKHWSDGSATPSECAIGPGGQCPRTGMVAYEPIVAEVLATDVLPALVNVSKILDGISIKHCDAVDAKGLCTKTTTLSGIDVAARATRAALDPDYARSIGLKNRRGVATGRRNDGTTNPQASIAYLLTNALSDIDEAFEQYGATHPEDKERLVQWRRARSQLADQFLGVAGSGSGSKFKNPTLPRMTPVLVELLRAQLWSRCPTSFVPPYDRCKWATEELTTRMNAVVKGPAFAGALDLGDAVRRDPEARRELEQLLDYLLNSASGNEALPAVLASMNDAVMVLRDDTNLVPFYAIVAEALAASKTDASGKVTQKGLVDANTALLARISGKAFDKDGNEVCSRELDPNQILSIMLANLVTPPAPTAPNKPTQTPLEVLIEVIADVNKASPEKPLEKLTPADYQSISDNVADFLLNKERGLEQFYEVIRQGTPK